MAIMSVTSNELNYLIWRYLQETGNELTAYALQKETQVQTLDPVYEDRIPIGCLVDLVQKGIFYCEADQLVDEKGCLRSKDDIKSRFSLFQALKDSQTEEIESTGRFALRVAEEESKNNDVAESQEKEQQGPLADETLKEIVAKTDEDNKMDLVSTEEEDFIKVLTPIKTFPPGTSSSWNPTATSTLSLGEHKSNAIITTLSDIKDGICQSKDISLPHPLSISVTLSSQDNKFSEDITCVSWSNKGNFLLTGSYNGELRLWTIDGKLRNVLTLHHAPIISIKWNFDNAYVLSHDQANNTIIWNVATGTAVQHIHHDILKNALTPTSQVAAAAGSISTNTSEIYGTDPIWLQNTIYAVPGIAGEIFLFNVTLRQPVPIGKLLGHTAAIGCTSYNEKLKLLATGSDDATVRIWKGKSQSSSQILMGHDQAIISVDWLNMLEEEQDTIQKETAKNKECQYILTSSLDGSVRVWNAYSGKMVAISFLDGIPIFEAKLSPSKNLFAVSTEEGTVSIFNVSLASLEKIINVEKQTGSSLIVGDVAKLKIQAQYILSGPENSENYVTSVTWSSDSTKLCVSYNESETVIFQM